MILAINRLNHYYGDSHTLWDLDLAVPAGTCVCLMGRNGVGKTTLLKCIMGLLPVRGGTIQMQGKELTRIPAEDRARMGIGYVPQGRDIFPLLTVEENLRTGLTALANGERQIPPLVLEIFPQLKQMWHRRGGDLSGGQQQQLAIGRALVLSSKLLILDEPIEGLQPNLVHQIGDVVRKLNKEHGLTVLLVEQNLPFARRMADRFYIIQKGRVVAGAEMTQLNDDLIRQYLTV